jgi:glutamine amidotransferase
MVEAQNAILRQSRADLRGVANPDGWGIAYYTDGRLIVEKRARAAYEDLHFSETARQILTATLVAHVRAATVGSPSITNTHPFRFGPWAFAHNGTVTAFDDVRPVLAAETNPDLWETRQGETDSEAVFRWLLGRMDRYDLDPRAPSEELEPLRRLLSEAVPYLAGLSDQAGAQKPAKLNLLLTDGRHLAVSRWGNTLHWAERRGLWDCDVCSRSHFDGDPTSSYRSAIVASEPITREQWREVPDASLVAVTPDFSVTVEPLAD